MSEEVEVKEVEVDWITNYGTSFTGKDTVFIINDDIIGEMSHVEIHVDYRPFCNQRGL